MLREGPVGELVLSARDGSPAAHLAWSGPAPVRDGDLPPGPFGRRIASAIAERALLPVVTVRSTARHLVRRDRRGTAVVTATLHRDATVLADDHAGTEATALAPTIVELHGVHGHTGQLDRAAGRVAASAVAQVEGELLDVALTATGRSAAGVESSPTVPLSPDDDALDAVRRVLRNLLDTIELNRPGTIADLDPEFLHELRVAVRRTRSVLAETKKVLPSDVRDEQRAVFKDLGLVTSRTRDLDVHVLGWDDLTATLDGPERDAVGPLRDVLEADRLGAHREMCEVLTSDPTRAVLDRWRAWLDDPDPDPAAPRPRPIGPFVARRIRSAQDVLISAGRAITPASPAESLHDLRKDAKKLRYLLECFGSLVPRGARKAFVGQLKALQDNLGTFQDLEVQINELRDLAEILHRRSDTAAETLLATGRLIDHLEQARHRERDDFVARFAGYDTPENQATLDALLAGLEER